MTEGVRLRDLSVAVRESTIKRLRRVPAGSENWRPSSNSMSFAEIAVHLADADRWLFQKLKSSDLPHMVATISRKEWTQQEYEALILNLAQLGRERDEILGAMTEKDLAATMTDDRFDGIVTAWWVIVRGNLDHEAHHRGQLAAYLGIVKASVPGKS